MPSQLLRFWPVWSVYWRNRWDFARFSLVFRLLEALLFAPLAAVAGHALVGQPVIDSTDLVRYALSVRGFAATFLGATVFLTLRMVEEAGLSAIAWGALQEQPLRAGRAVRIVAGILPRLLRLGGMILAAGVLLVTPLAAVTAWCAGRLLKQHDINYYLAFRPPEFLGAIATVVAVALPTAAIALWLAVRWRLAVQVVLGERQSTWGVLRSSTRLVRGAWKRIAAAWLGTALLVIGLGLLASLLSRACGWGAAWLASDRFREQILIFVILQVLRVVLTSYVTLPGSCLTASVFTALYLEQRGATVGALGGPVQQALPGEDSSPVPGPVRRLAAGLPLVMIGASVVGNILSLEQLYTQHPVAVTAHRGGTVKSIENTLGAVREAINDGAQFAEIDVQMSRDAVLVVTHDSDLSRLAGVSRKVWEMTWDEIRAISLRRGVPAATDDDRTPTLDEVLELARGRIRLNIELKYYGDHQPQLAERVVEAVVRARMSEQVIIQSLHYDGLLETRRAAPVIPIGYLFSVNARTPKRLQVDFLSVQIGRVNAPFVTAAHRRGQEVHVWTVDKPADMQRMLDLGADNLITNRPREALELIRQQAQLSVTQRALRRVRVWMSE